MINQPQRKRPGWLDVPEEEVERIKAESAAYWQEVRAGQAAEESAQKPTGIGDANCTACLGMGYFTYDVPPEHQEFGRMHKCPCTSNTPDEQARMWARSGVPLDCRDLDVFADGGTYGLSTLEGRRIANELARLFTSNVITQEISHSITLIGPYGSGKTFTGRAIAATLIRAGVEARYITLREFRDDLQGSFSGNAADTLVIRRKYENVPVMVIDELEKVQPTGWSIDMVFALANARFDKRGFTSTVWLFSDEFHKKKGGAEFRDIHSRAMTGRANGWVAEITSGDLREVS
jgi:hypothetical protein